MNHILGSFAAEFFHQSRKSLSICLRDPVITCFLELESRNLNNLVLICFRLARVRARGREVQPSARCGFRLMRDAPTGGFGYNLKAILLQIRCE